MDVSISQHLENTQRQLAAHAYTAACMFTFAVGLQYLPCKSSLRAVWAFVVSIVYLYTQPFIYATSTQPQSIGIASVAMMVSWTILDWGLLQPTNSRPSPSEVYKSLFHHVMFGVAKVHKRRTRFREAGVAPAATRAMHAAEGIPEQQCSKQEVKPVVHIDAIGVHEAQDNTAPDASSVMAAVSERSSRNGEAVDSGLLLSCDFNESTAALAAAMTSNLEPLIQALWVLTRLVIQYDIGFAVLCCIGGNMWKASSHQQQLDQGLLGALLGPRLTHYAFHYGVSFLLPMQMGIAYASIKVVLAVLGQVMADSLPAEAFNSPVLSTSISDLWGNRWHQFLRYYFQGLGYTLVDKIIQPLSQQLLPVRWQKNALAAARSLVVFVMSGVWHEYITWAAYGIITGKYMAFFMLHGLAVIVESYAARLVPATGQARVPHWLRRVYATLFMVVTTPLFTVPYQQSGYLEHCFHPFVVPVTATLARWAGVCAC